ncbi:hypothetical protein AN948_01535 [Rhodococcus sp. ADH]|uniref:hypothetical protein n=1 Tax=Rhodococcus sp. ADH TaxID=224843 RepID=UPI0006BA23D9|nr:hypothetical protein [Rhodococcus sp. ADH]KPH21474.1 hypothetical protein AN948_01535 [Rhodococcus sp. ADH]
MFNLAPYVESWMDRLGKERPLFHSESDFQLALATVMADEVEQVRLEKKVAVSERVGGRSRLAVDVLGRLGGRRIALELKYPKKRLLADVDGEVFELSSSGAPDLDTAAIWRDAQRVERLILDGSVEAGASLTLTNYPFWSERNSTVRSQAHEFRLWEGRRVEPGSLRWQLKNDRVGESLSFESGYRCSWRDYGGTQSFGLRYLLLQPSLRQQTSGGLISDLPGH